MLANSRAITPSDQRIIRRFKALLNDRVRLYSLTLFGSRARADAEPDSDMDVLVIVKEVGPDVERAVSECAWLASLESGVIIVPVVYSLDEWTNGPERSSLLAIAIKREGVPA